MLFSRPDTLHRMDLSGSPRSTHITWSGPDHELHTRTIEWEPFATWEDVDLVVAWMLDCIERQDQAYEPPFALQMVHSLS